MEYAFTHQDKVRDYECDLQGVVNNSVYLNYLEHARHEYLLHLGVDFAGLAAKGINLVVVRSEVDYKKSLRPGDEYWIGISLVRSSRIKFDFLQDIYKKGDTTPTIKAKVTGVALNEKGRPCTIPELDNAFEAIDAPN